MPKVPTEIKSLARSHTVTAINTLKGIMQEKKAPPAARVAAAQALLDRGWGKPDQHNTNDTTLEVGASFQRILEYIGQHGSMKPRDGDGA